MRPHNEQPIFVWFISSYRGFQRDTQVVSRAPLLQNANENDFDCECDSDFHFHITHTPRKPVQQSFGNGIRTSFINFTHFISC